VLNRSWIAFVTVLALVLTIMCTLSILQFGAVQTKLLQDRLAVIANTAAGPFRSVIEFGLPISTVRNADDLLARAKAIDPIVQGIQVFHQTGIVVHATEDTASRLIPREILFQQSTATEDRWVASHGGNLSAGLTLRGLTGKLIGGVLVSAPGAGLDSKIERVTRGLSLATLIVWVAFSAIGYIVLGKRMGALWNGMEQLSRVAKRFRSADLSADDNRTDQSKAEGLLAREVIGLEQQLERAFANYQIAEFEIGKISKSGERSTSGQTTMNEPPRSVLAKNSGGRLALAVARHVTPLAAVTVFAAVLTLGVFVHRTVATSFTPELTARTALIGAAANQNIQHAIDAGVPLENLVGAESYFDDLLSNFPEVSYFGIATGRIIFEAGSRQETLFAPRRSQKDVPTFPIYDDGEQIGYILVDANPNFFATEFREILLDFSVVLLVVMLLTYQIVTLVISRSLTAPFVQLQYLAGLQATGDFSKTLAARGKTAIDDLSRQLSNRAFALHAQVQELASLNFATSEHSRMSRLRTRFSLTNDQPDRLRFAYLNDLRLPLFLFTAADELPLAFFPLYTRAADNPLTWLDPGVVISLPLAGYLIAIVFGSPFTRPLATKLGYRKLLLLALVPTLLAHLGLYFATTTPEIILYRTLAGLGYAIVTLACQDYVLDATSPEERSRTLATFTGAAYSGIFAGTALGGVLADRLGQSEVFIVSAALVFLSAILIHRLLPRISAVSPAVSSHRSTLFPPIWKPLTNRRFFALVMGVAVPSNIVQQAFISFLVALQLNELGASAADTGRILMVYFIAIVFVGPLPSLLMRRGVRPSWVVLAGAMISAISLSLTLLAPGIWTMLLTVAGTGVGSGMIRDTQVAITMKIVDDDPEIIESDAMLGAMRTIERFSSVVGLVMLAFLASIAGYSASTAAMCALVLAGALLFAGVNLRRAFN
jgi:MFS family permease